MNNKVLGTFKKTDGSLFTVTDGHYKKMREMTEEDIHEAALSDPDAQPLTAEQLAKFEPVNPFVRMKKK